MKALLFMFLICCSFSGWSQQIDSLNSLSKNYYQKGDYAQALQHAQKAYNLSATHQKNNIEHQINSLTNVGYAQLALNHYKLSLATFKRLNKLSFDAFPNPHAQQLHSLHEIAKAYAAMSIYDSASYTLENARELYLTLIETNSAIEKSNFYELADTYFKINAIDASIHHQLGQTIKAIEILEDNKTAIINTYPHSYESIADYQTNIHNLCTYYLATDHLEAAKTYAQTYLKLCQDSQKAVAEISALTNLGSVYRKLMQMDSALYYWDKAKQQIVVSQLTESDLFISLLNNIGELNFEIEEYDTAIKTFQKAQAILQKQAHPNPFKSEIVEFNLAESYYLSGQYEKADSAYQYLIEEVLLDLKHHFTYLSDVEKIAYYRRQQTIIESFTNFALEVTELPALQASDSPYINMNLLGTLYNLQLNTKAIILNESKRMRRSILSSKDEPLIQHYLIWQNQKNVLAKMLIAQEKYSVQQIDSLATLAEANEKWLTKASRKFRQGFVIETIRWQEVQKALKTDEAAIEIIRLANGLAYGALIITANTTESPVFSLLLSKKGKLLEKASFSAYLNAIKYKQQDSYSYTTYWQPIIDSLINHMPNKSMPKIIYLSADGIYNQMNVNTFYDTATQTYVLDQTAIIPLTNTKEILQPATQIQHKESMNIALFGDINFSHLNETSQQYPPLPGTKEEVNEIKVIMDKANWNSYIFTDTSANEQQFKALKNMHVIHIASHAYFQSAKEGEPFSLTNSLIESGVLLASKNNSHGEDGILSALETSSLELDQTPLVVLSACETARGTQYFGEGVYGLQRSLRVAGAAHLMMSLWKVDDEATQALMTSFYQHWTKQADLREAFVAAQKSLRHNYPHPYYWGAFILTGK